MRRLSKSRIEWLANSDRSQGYTWGIYSGCYNWRNGICAVGGNCWAKKQTERFNVHYPNGFLPTFYPEALLSPLHLRRPSRIGVAFMGDLFGDWVNPDMLISPLLVKGDVYIAEAMKTVDRFDLPVLPVSLRKWIFAVIDRCPQHTFIFLTKCPWNLARWLPWPENCWIGASATDTIHFEAAHKALCNSPAKRFISFEPLLEKISPPKGEWGTWDLNVYLQECADWVIIGAQTQPYRLPRREWVEEIIVEADKVGIPVFVKNNLRPLLGDNLRQEWPR